MREQLKNFFVPHDGNDYKPNSLEKAAVVGMMVLILLSFTLANLQSIIWMSSEWMVSTILPSVIVDLTNKERKEVSLGDLRRNATLDSAAQLKAQHMATNQYFAHYSPDGISPWHWFSVANYNYVHAGENLAIHFTDSSQVVNAWMNSPTHRANIVNGKYTEIGVGTARGTYEGFDTVYVVQLFGTPAAVATPTSVPRPTPAPVVTPRPAVLAETESVVEEEVVSQAEPQTPPIIAGSEELVDEIDDTTVVLSTERDPIIVDEFEVATSSETATTSLPATTSEPVAEEIHVAYVEDDVMFFTDLVSTSTGGVPASVEPTENVPVSTSPVLAAATQPHIVLQILYTAIASFVFIALMLSIFIEVRRQHPIQIAYSAGLVAVMIMLLYVHLSLTAGAVIA